MKLKTFLLNFLIGWITFAIGFGWFTAYRYFVSHSSNPHFEGVEEVEESEARYRSIELEMNDAIQRERLAAEDAADKVREAARIAVANAEEAARENEKTPEEEFLTTLDIEGYYEPPYDPAYQPAGPTMEIWLGEYDDNLEEWVVGPPRGFVKIREKSYEFAKIAYSNGTLSFETVTKKGVSYVFNGKYTKKPWSNGFDKYDIRVLSGKLTKFTEKRIVDETRVELTWHQGC